MTHASPRPPARAAGLFPAALTALLTALLPCPAGAQDAPRSPVSLDVRGLSGQVLKARPRRFLAVQVEVSNAGAADASGRLRVYRSKGHNNPAPEQVLFYERRVELPGGSRRKETLYYHCQEHEPGTLAVAYEPEDGDVQAPPPSYPQVQVEPCELSAGALRSDGEFEPGKFRVLALTSRGGEDAAGILRNALLPGPRLPVGVVIERADLSALPDHAAGYESCEAVLVSDLNPDDLPPALAAPLLAWVAAGGQLVVAWAGRPEQLERSALVKALPIARRPGQGASQRGLRALRALARGRPAPPDDKVLVDLVVPLPGSDVLAADGQGPLAVRGRYGAGWITYVAFPLDAAPLRRWEGAAHAAGSLLRLPLEETSPPASQTDAPPFEELLLNLSEALETLNPPSLLLVAPLLLLYVVLVAPVNYKLLQRRRRLAWAQPIAAGIALAFGLVFYGLGRIYKGSESLMTQVGLIELAACPGPSRVETMTGYFATEQGLVDGTGPKGGVVGPIAEQASNREGRVVHDPAGDRLESVTLATWALRRFRSLRAQDLGHVQGELRQLENRLAGSLENKSQLRLLSPVLLTDAGFIQLEDLDPGTIRTLPPTAPRAYEDQDPRQVPFFRGLLEDGGGPGRFTARYGLYNGLGGIGDPYKGRSDLRLLGAFRGRLARAPRTGGRMPVLLLARAGEVQGVSLEGSARTVLERGVVICELSAPVASGKVRLLELPPQVARARGEWRALTDATGAPPQMGGSESSPAEVEYVWTLPGSLEAPLEVESLRLTWAVGATIQMAEKTVFYGWSWSLRDWIPLVDAFDPTGVDARQRAYWTPKRGADPSDLVDPATGTVRVLLRNKGYTDLTVMHVSLSVSGKLPPPEVEQSGPR